MKIVFIITSSGDAYYCGNCFRDNLMAQAMKKAGHEVIIMPIYLPLRQKSFQADTPLFFPATTYYVAQKFFGRRSVPAWLQKLLGAQPLLNLAMSMAGTTTSDGMEDMTLSMITGEGKAFTDMVRPMIDWILDIERPDVVYISSTMLMGIAKALRGEQTNPRWSILQGRFPQLLCMAQDEEVWIDGLRPADAQRAWQGIAENLRYVDAVITTSQYYKEKMARLLNNSQFSIFNSQLVNVVYPGIDLEAYPPCPLPEHPTIGFFYRMNQLDGLDVLAEAFVRLKKKNAVPGLRLHIGGGHTSQDKKFLDRVRRTLKPYMTDVRIEEDYDWEHHAPFYRDISAVCVPLQFEETVGLYLLEAFATGRPAIEPNIGSFREIVGEAGIVYPKNDAATLADAIEQFFTTPGRLRQCSEEALRLARERYNAEVTAKGITEIINKLNNNKDENN